MATSLTQDFYNDLKPSQRKSIKASSWSIDEVVDTSLRNQKVTLTGESDSDPETNGIEFSSSGGLITGSKGDTIIGSGSLSGISMSAGTLIDTAEGNDTLNATGGSAGYGIFMAAAEILTRQGNDSINATGGEAGIYAIGSSLIDTGEGNDSVNGFGTGGLGGLSGGVGIQLGAIGLGDGSIDTGDGNDSVTGSGVNVGIQLHGDSSISTGAGNDTVDAITGGFAGKGTIDLGEDDDTLIGGGFGSAIEFDGGEGAADKIVLGNGSYTYDASRNELSNGSDVMNIINFEQISGIDGTIDQFQVVNDIGTASLVDGNTYNVVAGLLQVIV